MVMAATLALSGLPLSGVFRSEFEIVAGGFAHAQYVGVAILIAFANLAFCGVVWHSARMVFGTAPGSPPPAQNRRPPAERSPWMVAGMLVCLLVVVALGVHLPGDLAALLHTAGRVMSAAPR